MGRWTCTIIQNTENGLYHVADFTIEGKDITEKFRVPFDLDYRHLMSFIRKETGIEILNRKDMIFERLSDFEKIATIDATQYRGEDKDCRVTIKERIAGWQPCFD